MPFDHGLPGTPSTHNADDYPTVAAVKYMSQLLAQKSGGKNKIKDFNKQALGSEKVTVDQVKIGTLDLTRVNVGPMNAICPLTQVPTMPFLFSSIAHLRKSLDGPVGTRSSRAASRPVSSAWPSTTAARARSMPRSRSRPWPMPRA